MSNFAILRFEKIKSLSQLGKANNHNKRKSKTPNADPDRTRKNVTLINRGSVVTAWKKRVQHYDVKVRKNAVVAIESVQTYSPEMRGKINVDEWARDSLKFLEDKFGRENILSAIIHNDETTPHLQALIIPLKQKTNIRSGKTSIKIVARDYISGDDTLSDLQTEYADRVKSHGLRRGIFNSKATHKTIKQFYGELKRDAAELEKIKNEIDEIKFKYEKTPAYKLIKKSKLLNRLSNKFFNFYLNFVNKEKDFKLKISTIEKNNTALSRKLTKSRQNALELSEQVHESENLINQFKSRIEALESENNSLKYNSTANHEQIITDLTSERDKYKSAYRDLKRKINQDHEDHLER